VSGMSPVSGHTGTVLRPSPSQHGFYDMPVVKLQAAGRADITAYAVQVVRPPG